MLGTDFFRSLLGECTGLECAVYADFFLGARASWWDGLECSLR